jgi:thiamine pyrophosphokinase
MPAKGGNLSVALVFAGGDAPPAEVARHLPSDAFVIAADSGLEHALALGRAADLVVGDLDSVDGDALQRAIAAGALVEQHPVEKDSTDLDLALECCVQRELARTTVVGGHGGRLDHFAANLLLLASPRFEALELDAWMGDAHVLVVRDSQEIHGRPGSLCTLLAAGRTAHGVTTAGLRYPLRDAVLEPGSTLGVSNELVERVATVSVTSGELLAILPDALAVSEGER